MTRDQALTQPTKFEVPGGGVVQVGGTRGKKSTRMKFPQVSADLKVRWCSAYLKIDVCATAMRNQERFNNSRTLLVTGERAEESASRAKYKTFEPDRSDNRTGRSKRHIDHWRPVHGWSEQKVWDIIERHRVNVHPAYHLGWGRVSCSACIFGNGDQWASLRRIAPKQFNAVAKYEADFGLTIHRTKTITEQADKGTPYETTGDTGTALSSQEQSYRRDIILPEHEQWVLPVGAFGDSCGPT